MIVRMIEHHSRFSLVIKASNFEAARKHTDNIIKESFDLEPDQIISNTLHHEIDDQFLWKLHLSGRNLLDDWVTCERCQKFTPLDQSMLVMDCDLCPECYDELGRTEDQPCQTTNP